MDVLVTGASGRLGSQVVRHLAGQGWSVRGVDLRPPAEALPGEHTVCDLKDYDAARRAVEGVRVLCHLGNQPGLGAEARSFAAGFTNNVGGTYNLLEAARAAGCNRVVYASSVQVYGMLSHNLRRADGSLVTVPPAYLPVDEDHPLQPGTPYATSKAMCEAAIEAFCRVDPGMSAVSLRYVWIRPMMPPAVTAGAPPRPPRSDEDWLMGGLYVYVSAADAARAAELACAKVAGTAGLGHRAVNILNRTPLTSWNPVTMRNVWGAVPELRDGLTPTDPLVSSRGAEELLGFVAEGA